MSAPTPPAKLPEPPEPKAERRPAREQARTASLVVIAVLITVFAFKNLDKVKVDWVVGSGHAPLIIVIVVSLLVGIVLTYIAERRGNKRRGSR